MERRKLLKMISVVTGSAFIGSEALAYEIKGLVPLSKTVFSPEEVSFFNEIAEVIIPRTETPGAKDANVGQMALVLANDCYSEIEKTTFIKGFRSINSLCKSQFGKEFLLLSDEDRKKFVSALDVEAEEYNNNAKIYYRHSIPNGDDNPNVPHYFTLIKQLTLFSFFTSEIGATKVLRFEAVPGKYDGNLDYKKGDRAWAT